MKFIDVDINFDISREMRQVVKAIEMELWAIGKDVREKIIQLMKERGKRATGDMIASVDEKVRVHMDRMILEVGPNVSYALWVEDDTKPHWAPIDPLKKWVRIKFGLGGKEKNAVAYAVQAAIAKKGTKGAKFMRDTWKIYRPQIVPRLVRAIDAEILAGAR